jgi:undecaprenyl-diphosphatase
MPKITLLGDMGAVWIVAALVMICTKKYRKHGIILLAGLALGVLVGNVALKHLIARPRPCWLDTSVQLLIANPTDYSFPSGHTLSSVIGATILTLTNRKFGWAAIPVAALIAFSRLYLYVHFPSDILGAVFIGLIIGIAVFYAGNAAWKWIEKRKKPQAL